MIVGRSGVGIRKGFKMNRGILAIVAILIFTSSAVQIYPLPATPASAESHSGPVIITAGEPSVTDNSLVWRYQIRNDSARDMWVCGNLEIHCCEAHLAQDNQTLLIRRRLDLRAERLPGVQPSGRYVRLRKGETRTELVSFSLPIQPENVVSEARRERPLEYATRVVREGLRDSFVWEHGVAELTCYSNDERLMCFKAYNGSKIMTSCGQVFQYEYPMGLSSLSRVTPTVRSFDLRVQCAANLRNVWYRLCLYHRVKAAASGGPVGDTEKSYPRARKWCDTISSTYWRLGKAIPRPFRCPSGPEGKCHYAMNVDCTYDSPADTVLLFETKPAWNCHGGPKLFTFNNHEPRGGLVLLNDVAVKFIRTEAELKQLRWK